jgi:hypothetical protein
VPDNAGNDASARECISQVVPIEINQLSPLLFGRDEE